jgi:hypothetical protein
MSTELVFSVDDDKALAAVAIGLADAGLREREHLQEWIIANPAILGSGVLIVTSEFDRWAARVGAARDRLDILGLDMEGRLVVAELKRDAAPDTVEMQAIKYAAMASRFDLEVLADALSEFRRRTTGETLTSEESAELLSAHTDYRLTSETLRAPRIVLVAGSFPTSVTATSVWLTEMGLDITLVQIQAYRTGAGVIITASQHYPPPNVEEFTVAPTRASRRPLPEASYPLTEWTAEDYTRAATELRNPTALAALDLCSARPGEWVPFEDIIVASGRNPAQARGDTGALTLQIRKLFKRNSWPYEAMWAAGGTQQIYYRMTEDQAEMWRTARGEEVILDQAPAAESVSGPQAEDTNSIASPGFGGVTSGNDI